MEVLVKNEKYHLIKEREFIAIYNIRDQKVERLIKVEPQYEEVYLKINDTKWVSEQQGQWSELLNKLNRLCPDLILDLDDRTVGQMILLENAAEAFAESNYTFYSLHKEMILLNVKEILLYYQIINFSMRTQLNFSLFKHFENRNTLPDTTRDNPMEINLIDNSSYNNDILMSYETEMIRKNGIRIYYQDTGKEIVLGAGFVGNDYGCLFCNKENLSLSRAITIEISALLSSLLQFELIKYNRNLLAFLNEDITLTKGKKFMIDKSTFEARDIHNKRNSSCICCTNQFITN
jgi:hypothetical protein